MVHVTARIDAPGTWTLAGVSGWACVVFVAAILGVAVAESNPALAVYALSFWHYYLYALAYRFGAVGIQPFKRDAVLMKTVALGLLGWVYLAAAFGPLSVVNLLSLAIVAAGFGLNALGARALGTDRTYYGYELADLPAEHVTRFPFSWIAHPMLVGNVVAYSATLLVAEFRADWWPLASLHVAANVGLLLMEVAVKPLRLATQGARERQPGRLGAIAFSLAVAAGLGIWAASQTDAAAGAIVAACVACYTYGIYRCYAAPRRIMAAGNQGEEIR